MKRAQTYILSAVLMLFMALSLAPNAYAAIYDYPVQGGDLQFDPTTGTITDCDISVYAADIPSTIYGIKVTKIGDSAFAGCGKLTSVTIPSTVTSIGTHAFFDCRKLISVSIPDSVTSFGGGAAGTMYEGVFASCTSLESVSIPGSIKVLPRSTFSGCNNLKNVTLGEGIERISPSVTSGSNYPGNALFTQCKYLEEISIPDSVVEIGRLAYNCPSLSVVTMGRNVKYLGYRAFDTCPSLSSIFFKGNAPSAASNAFYGKFGAGFKILYAPGTTGWTTPTWNGFITGTHATVTLDANGGTVSKTSWLQVTGTTFGTLPTPTRAGYTFDGWYTARTGGELVTSDTVVTKDITLYAHWTQNAPTTYTITLNANGGKVSQSSVKVEANTAYYSKLPTPTRTGYTFSGWYTAQSGGTKITSSSKATGNTTLYAHWTQNAAKTYTITLNANGGKVSQSSVKVEANTAYYSKLPTPTRTGYKFNGWYTAKTGGTKITASTKATASRTIYAHWTEQETDPTGIVTFNANGGTVHQRCKAVLRGTRYRDLPTPTRAGYHFQGWYTKPTGGTKVLKTTYVTTAGDHTLYARWTKTAPTVRTTKPGSYTVYIPPYYKLPLYATNTTATQSKVNPASASEYTIQCTKMVTLSNGTTRYYGKVNGVNRWFQFTCEMDID